MRPLVSYLLITRDRFGDLKEALCSIEEQDYPRIEVVIVDNASNRADYEAFADRHGDKDHVRLFRSQENLGVSGGRNFGLKRVQGEHIITLDDDAVLSNRDLTQQVVDRFERDSDLGVLAFRILQYDDGELEEGAFPWKDKSRPADEEFETSWFIGAGHAIRQRVYEDVGLYRDYHPYGHEELDFSMRVVDAGWKIVYFPAAEVLHKKTPTSRIFAESTRFHANQLSKRIMVAIRNLPWRYVFTTAVLRTGQVLLLRTRFNLFAVALAYTDLISSVSDLLKEREVVSDRAVEKMRALKGPVVF